MGVSTYSQEEEVHNLADVVQQLKAQVASFNVSSDK